MMRPSHDDEDETIPNDRGGDGSRSRTTTRTVGGVTEKQLGYIRRLRTELGWSQEDVRGLSQRLFETDDVPSLNQTQASALIAELRKHQQAQHAVTNDPDAVPF